MEHLLGREDSGLVLIPPQEGPPKENMAKPVETSQYGLINFESVSTGLNIWTVIITLIIILALVCMCEACCGGPSTWLKCCFKHR